MSKANELLKKIDETAYPSDEEREKALLEICRNYDHTDADDMRGRASLYNELGSFYRSRRMLDKAEAAYKYAIEIMKTPVKVGTSQPVCKSCSFEIDSVSIQDDTDIYSGDYGTILNNLAGCYRLQGRFDEALKMFDQVEQIYVSLEDFPKELLASCKNNKGLVYLDKKEFSKAETCFNEAFDILKDEDESTYEMAMTYGNMAVAHYEMGKNEVALKELEKGLEILKKVTGEEAPVYKSLQSLQKAVADSGGNY